MANTPDNTNRPDVTLDTEVQKKMQAEGVIKLKTPAKFKEEMGTKEKETLDYFRDKDVDFWKRVGRYEKLIKARAKDELQDSTDGLLKRMRDLNSSTANRLRFFSRKNADRFAEITSRINVASRTLSAIRKNRILTKEIAAVQRIGNEGCRQQIMADHPWTAKIPLVKGWLVPSDQELTKPKQLDYEKLERAAIKVQSKESAKRAEWEAAIAKRYPIRSTEDSIREIILKQNPGAIDEINEALLEHSSGRSSTKLNDLIESLPANGIDTGTLKEVKNDLRRWAKNLKAKSGQTSKAFELGGQLELTGGPYERVQQIQRYLPVGTRFKVKGKFTSTEQEMVLEAKKPANYLVFKKVGSDERFAVHTTQRAAWSYVAHSPTEENEYKAQTVREAVIAEIKKYGVTDAEKLKKIGESVSSSFITEIANTTPTSKNVSDAVVAQLTSEKITLDTTQQTNLEKVASGAASSAFKPLTPTPTGFAKEIDFAHLEFNYA